MYAAPRQTGWRRWVSGAVQRRAPEQPFRFPRRGPKAIGNSSDTSAAFGTEYGFLTVLARPAMARDKTQIDRRAAI